MEGKVLGLPLIIWALILGIALLVDVPMLLLHTATQQRVAVLENAEMNTAGRLVELRKAVLTPMPTATPSASPVPTKAGLRPVVVTQTPINPTPVK